ncbi:hypothetical protein PQ478_09385 [Alkalihalophilus pseudofirmus]|uniref:hypothetical protein n=1 Tax=Alkalihalophilus pseudofirmus TaxID=79885 RepID=UPI00259BC5D3|nr:hypothetical protein [Alkalihalophilus pseudofirmus]WEG18680.1 hypothetical protein PQ478_09385 [Alkalihalophilus pseudofirmus]
MYVHPQKPKITDKQIIKFMEFMRPQGYTLTIIQSAGFKVLKFTRVNEVNKITLAKHHPMNDYYYYYSSELATPYIQNKVNQFFGLNINVNKLDDERSKVKASINKNAIRLQIDYYLMELFDYMKVGDKDKIADTKATLQKLSDQLS